jgi:hypothetical protein
LCGFHIRAISTPCQQHWTPRERFHLRRDLAVHQKRTMRVCA